MLKKSVAELGKAVIRPAGLLLPFREDIESILESVGFRRAQAGEPGILYFQVARWLIRLRLLPLFLRKRPVSTAMRLIRPRTVRFRECAELDRYPVLYIRDRGRPKVSFFDPAGKQRKVVWVHQEDCLAEIFGMEHFGKKPSRTAPVVSVDKKSNTVVQELVGDFLGKCASFAALIEFFIEIHTSSYCAVLDSREYLDRWRAAWVGNEEYPVWLRDSSASAYEFLQKLSEEGGITRIPMTLSHGDMSTANALLDYDGNIHLIDFDSAACRSIIYDFTFLHVTDQRMTRKKLISVLQQLRITDGNRSLMDERTLYLASLSLFVLEAGMDLLQRFNNNSGADRKPSTRFGYFVTSVEMLLKEL